MNIKSRKMVVVFLLLLTTTFALSQIGSKAFSLFNEGASLYRRGRFNAAIAKFLEAATLYKKTANHEKFKLGNMYGWVGYSYYMLKRYEKAVSYYKKAYLINKAIDNKNNMSSYLYNMGLAYRAWQRFSDAVKKFKQALVINKQLQRPQQYATYLFAIGMTYSQWQKYSAAAQSFQATIDAERVVGRRKNLATYYYYLGVAYRKGQKLKLALLAMQQAVRLGRSQPHYMPTFINGVGNIYKDQRQYAKAAVNYKKAYQLSLAFRNARYQLVYLENLIDCYRLLGDKKTENDYREKMLLVVRTLQDAGRQLRLLEQIAAFYGSIKNYRQTAFYLKKIIALHRRYDRKKKIAYAVNQLGTAYYHMKKYQDALKNYWRALRTYASLGNQRYVSIMYNNIGASYDSMRRYSDAVNYYNKALDIAKKTGDKKDSAQYLNNIGMTYKSWEKFITALSYFKQALRIDKSLKRSSDICRDYLNIGQVYQTLSRLNDAFFSFKKAQSFAVKAGNKTQIGKSYINLAQLSQLWGKYSEALRLLKRALPIFKKLADQDGEATVLNNIAELYRAQGAFDKALVLYQKSLAKYKKLGYKPGVVTCYNNMGLLYNEWGFYKRALSCFSKGVALNTQLGQKEVSAFLANNSGLSYLYLKKLKKALSLFRQALRIDKLLGKKRSLAVRYNNIGLVHLARDKYRRAITSFQRALAIEKKYGHKEKISVYLNNIGNAHRIMTNYKLALAYYKQAFALDNKQGNLPGKARGWGNIGITYCQAKQYSSAVNALRRAIAIIEKLRLTAPGKVRREYLASQIYYYRWLAASYLFNKQPYLSFAVTELSRAKYLAEQLNSTAKKKSIARIDLKKLLMHLPKNSAVISYLDIDNNNGLQMVVTKKFAAGSIVSKQMLQVDLALKKRISQSVTKLRGVKLVSMKKAVASNNKKEKNLLAHVVTYYRSLISKAQRTEKEMDDLNKVSRLLHRYLFGSIKGYLKGVKHLIIIPDGMLAFLPFEALSTKDGRYLIEKYSIKYAQSLSVLDIIAQRKYAVYRKRFLGYGGAVYRKSSYSQDMSSASISMDALKNSLALLASRGASTSKLYSMLGYTNWSNLPGSLTEIKAIGKVVKSSVVYTGSSVSEKSIKRLSRNGILAQFKVLHFATHGLVVPQIPELSALVLSAPPAGSINEDGYLRMSEIAKLRINADFVNLSACETGLGKIYDGEGVVGLTQSFLIAGANALSVSLWQVADRSTMQFMVGMYSLVENKKLSYLKAIRKMKLAFIRGDFGGRFSDPFYWAPFVYYGR